MKSSFKIFIKIGLFTYLLFLTPFFKVLPEFLGVNENTITSNIYEHNFQNESTPIKEQLNLMYVHENIQMSTNDEKTVMISTDVYVDNSKENMKEEASDHTNISSTGKKVYIYNTHQQEAYGDGKSVVDASIQLANQLQKAGIQVVYESNDFNAWLKNNKMDYNYSYYASNFYLNEAIVNHGGFDLMIDFHRDAVPRESSYVSINNKNYARLMFVVGGLCKNVEETTTLAQHLTNIVDAKLAGVIKKTMIREAYYNQDVTKNMILVEVGSDNNPYEEIVNSTNLLGEAIIQYLQG